MSVNPPEQELLTTTARAAALLHQIETRYEQMETRLEKQAAESARQIERAAQQARSDLASQGGQQ